MSEIEFTEVPAEIVADLFAGAGADAADITFGYALWFAGSTDGGEGVTVEAGEYAAELPVVSSESLTDADGVTWYAFAEVGTFGFRGWAAQVDGVTVVRESDEVRPEDLY